MAGSLDEHLVGIRLKVFEMLSFKRDMAVAAESIQGIKRSTDQTTAASKDASAGMFNLQRAMRWLTTSAFVGAIWGVVAGMKALAVNIVQTGLSFNSMKENALITFGVLTKSKSTAKTLFDQLMQLAKESPFDPENVQQGAQMLLTFGFAANQVVPIMRRLADVAAANPLFGPQVVQHLALVLGQIKSSGRLLGQDANQLAQFGINAYKIVAKRMFGVASVENQRRVKMLGEQGKLESGYVIDSIMKYIDVQYQIGGKRLSGLVSRGTFSGIVSNLRQAYQMAAGRLLEPYMKPLEGRLLGLSDALSGHRFDKRIDEFRSNVNALASALWPLIKGLGIFMGTMIKLTVGPILQLIHFLAPVLIPALRGLGKIFEWLGRHPALLGLALVLLPFFDLPVAILGAGLAVERIGLVFDRFYGTLTPVLHGLERVQKILRALTKIPAIAVSIHIGIELESKAKAILHALVGYLGGASGAVGGAIGGTPLGPGLAGADLLATRGPGFVKSLGSSGPAVKGGPAKLGKGAIAEGLAQGWLVPIDQQTGTQHASMFGSRDVHHQPVTLEVDGEPIARMTLRFIDGQLVAS